MKNINNSVVFDLKMQFGSQAVTITTEWILLQMSK